MFYAIVAGAPVSSDILAIGHKGAIPWHEPGDLQWFREYTLSNGNSSIVVMGRRTWESLPKRPLPGRINIVLTRSNALDCAPHHVCRDIDELLTLCQDMYAHRRVVIIGGAEIYRQAFERSLISEISVTTVQNSEVPPCECDTLLNISAIKDFEEISRVETSAYQITIYRRAQN